MEMNFTERDPMGNPGISHQILERNQNCRLFASACLQSRRLVWKLSKHAFASRLRNANLLADEFAVETGACHQRMNAPALRMPEHNDVFDRE